jgi:hypothetical protein
MNKRANCGNKTLQFEFSDFTKQRKKNTFTESEIPALIKEFGGFYSAGKIAFVASACGADALKMEVVPDGV